MSATHRFGLMLARGKTMKQIHIFIIFFLFMGIVHTEEKKFKFSEGVSGFTWGMGVEECKAKLKDIIAAIRLSDNEFILVAERGFALKFTNKSLTGVIHGDIFNWGISRMMDDRPEIVKNRQEITDGIRMDMSYQKINELLDGKIGKEPGFSAAIVMDGISINLKFSSSDIDGKKEYRLLWFSALANIAQSPSDLDVLKEIGR